MSFENRSGVFVVHYDTAADLDPAQQAGLVSALRAASLKAPVGVVFVVAPAVQMVGPEIPAFWLTVTSDKAVKIAAVAVVTPNPAISVATRGFSTANILRDTSVAVKPFPDEAAAVEWARAQVASRR